MKLFFFLLLTFATYPLQGFGSPEERIRELKNIIRCSALLENDLSMVRRRMDWADELQSLGLPMDAVAVMNGGPNPTDMVAAIVRSDFVQHYWHRLGKVELRPYDRPDYWGVGSARELVLLGGASELDPNQSAIRILNADGQVVEEWFEPRPLFPGLAVRRSLPSEPSSRTSAADGTAVQPVLGDLKFIRNGEVVYVYKSDWHNGRPVYSPDGRQIAILENVAGMPNKRVIVFEQEQGNWRPKQFAKEGNWKALEFTPDGQTIVVLDRDWNLLRGLDATDGTQKWKLNIPLGLAGKNWGLADVIDFQIRGNRAFVLAVNLTVDWLYYAIDAVIPIDLPIED